MINTITTTCKGCGASNLVYEDFIPIVEGDNEIAFEKVIICECGQIIESLGIYNSKMEVIEQ
jgi:hypothetical protein